MDPHLCVTASLSQLVNSYSWYCNWRQHTYAVTPLQLIYWSKHVLCSRWLTYTCFFPRRCGSLIVHAYSFSYALLLHLNSVSYSIITERYPDCRQAEETVIMYHILCLLHKTTREEAYINNQRILYGSS